MKKMLLILAFLPMIMANAQTENNGSGVLFLEGSMFRGFKSNDIIPIGTQLGLGYRLTNRFYPMLTVEYLSGHYKTTDIKTFYDSGNLGIALGYSLLKKEENDFSFLNNIDIRVNAGTTVGHTDWKYLYYGAELKLGFRKNNTPIIGIGYRYIDSHTETIDDYKGFYVSLGLRI
ncbi:MAG: hypothetical protein IJK43_02345 [Prevotella sp.]|nr:hypothetical protein [Prevotella sp.]